MRLDIANPNKQKFLCLVNVLAFHYICNINLFFVLEYACKTVFLASYVSSAVPFVVWQCVVGAR